MQAPKRAPEGGNHSATPPVGAVRKSTAHLANDPARAIGPYAAKAFEVPLLESLRNASNCWLKAGVTFTPHHPADASTNTANIKLSQNSSWTIPTTVCGSGIGIINPTANRCLPSHPDSGKARLYAEAFAQQFRCAVQ